MPELEQANNKDRELWRGGTFSTTMLMYAANECRL